jgi:tetratricopeptide (TPR) repeat protein
MRQAHERDPENAQARANLALALSELAQFYDDQRGDPRTARKHFLEVLKLREGLAADPANVTAQRDVAVTYLKLGRLAMRGMDRAGAHDWHQKACRRLELAAQADADNSELQRYLALANAVLGDLTADTDPKAARPYYRRALRLRRPLEEGDPNNLWARAEVADTHARLVVLYVRQRDEGRARTHALEAARRLETLPLDPKDLPVRIPRSITCNHLALFLADCTDPAHREPRRAVKLAEQAVALAPKFGTYRSTLGVAHYRAGNATAALEQFDQAKGLRVDGCKEWLFRALAHARLKELEEARRWFDRAERWLDAHPQMSADLTRLRDEAAATLGSAGPPKKEPKPADK